MLFINVPNEIQINVGKHWIEIKGPLGSCIKKKPSWLKLHYKHQRLYFLVNMKTSNELLKEVQFYSSLLLKIIWGFSKGYTKKLLLSGIGYRAKLIESERILELKLGLSHNVFFELPQDVEANISKKNASLIILKGNNKQRVNQIAAEIRNLKVPEIYKGKGIRYENEIIKLKEGKKSNL